MKIIITLLAIICILTCTLLQIHCGDKKEQETLETKNDLLNFMLSFNELESFMQNATIGQRIK